jgi:hypothetical protein
MPPLSLAFSSRNKGVHQCLLPFTLPQLLHLPSGSTLHEHFWGQRG